MKVLDVGCGNRKLRGSIGIDITNDHYSNSIDFGQKIDIYTDATKNLPYKDSSIDIVTCFNSLEYMNNPINALKEIHRVLKKDGLLVFFCYNTKFILRKKISPKNKLFTIENLRKTLTKIGFEIHKLNGQGNILSYELYGVAVKK